MSSDNPSFKSYCGEYFWSPASPEEQAKIAERIEKDCRRGHLSALVYVIFVVSFVLSQLVTFYYLGSAPGMLSLLCIVIFLWSIFPVIGSVITTSRYIKKAREGKFFCRHVTIEDKRRTEGTILPGYSLTIKSTGDRSDTAEVEIESGLYNRVSAGVTGMFVMIEDEPRKILCSPFWFIADTDPLPVTDGEASAAPAVPEAAGDDLHKQIRQRYYRYCTSYITCAVTASILYVITGLFMTIAFTSMFARMVMLFAIPMHFAAMLLMSFSFTRQTNKGRLIYSLAFFLWLNINVIAIAILTLYLEKGGAVVYVTIAAMIALDLITIFPVNIRASRITRHINKREYRVLPAEVISKDMNRSPLSFVTRYRCSVRTEDGRTYDIDIEKGIYNTIREGSKGHIIFPGDDESDRFFL